MTDKIPLEVVEAARRCKDKAEWAFINSERLDARDRQLIIEVAIQKVLDRKAVEIESLDMVPRNDFGKGYCAALATVIPILKEA